MIDLLRSAAPELRVEGWCWPSTSRWLLQQFNYVCYVAQSYSKTTHLVYRKMG